MPWRTISSSEVRLTPIEQAQLGAIQGSMTACDEILATVVGEFRDTIAAVGTTLGEDGTIPDMVRGAVIDRTRWLWLREFPQLKALQTDVRRDGNKAAEELLQAIATRERRVPPPDGYEQDTTVLPSIAERTRTFTRDTEEGL